MSIAKRFLFTILLTEVMDVKFSQATREEKNAKYHHSINHHVMTDSF